MLFEISGLKGKIKLTSLMGKPTSGKSLKAKILEIIGREFGVAKITTSEMIQWNIERDTALGRAYAKLRSSMETRKLIPCELILPGLADAIKRAHYVHGACEIILDGAPRKDPQAKAILESRVPYKLIEVDISDEEAVQRTHIRSLSAPRDDDKQIFTGLQVYRDESVPAIKIMKNAGGIYERIDGTQPIRSQIAHILRTMGFGKEQLGTMMKKLDTLGNAARQMIEDAEKATQTSRLQHDLELLGQHAWLDRPQYPSLRPVET